jgi:cell wall-associated NlpC family hydrolase
VRRFLLALAATLLAPATATAATPTLANWDTAQQRQVVRAGLLQNQGRSFNGAVRLRATDANAAMAALASRFQLASVAHVASGGAVTVTAFDALLVNQLGLRAVAADVQAATAAAGLSPPSYYGTEVVARFLGLRYDHPAGTDQLELYPYDPITRAEAAWSLAQVLGFGSWTTSYAEQSLAAFKLPKLTANQAAALRIAVSRIGYPYVWGGTTDNTADGLAHGGFDCSGFVWRVFKLSGLPWGREIGGRTAAQMAGEIPRGQRLRMSRLQPGDILFFGSAHFNSVATEANVIHTGIYMGDNWVINSSSQGVYVLPLKGSWLGSSFAWGRRVIG